MKFPRHVDLLCVRALSLSSSSPRPLIFVEPAFDLEHLMDFGASAGDAAVAGRNLELGEILAQGENSSVQDESSFLSLLLFFAFSVDFCRSFV